jgi:uncharacterized membrane protein
MTRPEQAQIAVLQAMLEQMDRRAEEDRATAKEDRDERRAAEAEAAKVRAQLFARVSSIEKRMDAVEPVAGMVKSWQARAMGGLAVIGALGAVILLVAATLWDAVIQWLQETLTRP